MDTLEIINLKSCAHRISIPTSQDISRNRLNLEISGLGIVFFSPTSVAHIEEGEDYFDSHFNEPSEVAQHVNECALTCFGTGGPGEYNLEFSLSKYPGAGYDNSDIAIRLGIEVKDRVLIFRDLYSMLDWDKDFSSDAKFELDNGFYLVTVCTSLPSTGLLGDSQNIKLWFEAKSKKTEINWPGVPMLIPGNV